MQKGDRARSEEVLWSASQGSVTFTEMFFGLCTACVCPDSWMWRFDMFFFFFSYKSQESSNTKNWSKLESGIFVSFSAMLTAEFCFAVLFELKFSICLTTGLGGEGCTKQVFAMGKYTNV